MTGIWGMINVDPSDDVMINTIGQQIVYDAANEYLMKHTEDMMLAYQAFVERETEQYKFRYKLPGGGQLQRRSGQTQSAATSPYGQWDVELPLEDFGAQITGTDVELAYMTAAEFQLHIDNLMIRDINTMRFEILYALFNNTARTFIDERKGTLTLKPLANSDGTLYPPVIGSDTESDDNHYLASGYTGANISDTNNPYLTIRNELEEHFGMPQGYGDLVAFIHTDQVAKTEDLTDFTPVELNTATYGDDTDRATNIPRVPGRVIGQSNGVWISEWKWIPTSYIFGLHLSAPPPLQVRRDPSTTGIPRGLQLVAQNDKHPLQAAHYRNRYGVAVTNRLNGVLMHLTASTFSIPTAYDV